MSEKNHVNKLTSIYQRHLQKLEELQAFYGMATPPHILMQIEDIEFMLEDLRRELGSTKDDESGGLAESQEQQLLNWLDCLDISQTEDATIGTPYIVGPPILNPHNFYGRQQFIADFFNNLFGPQMQSISVLGARRSGKTSLLYHIRNKDTLNSYLGEHHDSVIPVYLDLQIPLNGPEDFYRYLLRAMTRALEYFTRASSAPNLPGEISYAFIEEFFDKACGCGCRFVLLLDEFEKLGENKVFDEDFFTSLRALSTVRSIAWVTTSFRDIYQLGRKVGFGPSSPFFNIFRPIPLYLGALTEAGATQLVTEPASKAGYPFTDEEDVKFVLKLAGRLPFALQTASSILYQAHRNDNSGADAREYTRRKFSEAMKKHFDYYWTHFTSGEHQVLQSLAQNSKPTLDDNEALADLVNYGFVEKVGEDYRVLGDAFAEWIKTMTSK